jgi:hypothetical protein
VALLTMTDLRTWTRDDSIADDDPFALAIIDGVSLLVSEEASHPEWDVATVPPRAKLIACLVAKRNYLNPDAVRSTSVGPVSEQTLDDFVRTMELTEAESEALRAMAGDGGTPGSSSDLWLLPTGAPSAQDVPFYLPTTPNGSLIGPFATPDEVEWAWTPREGV